MKIKPITLEEISSAVNGNIGVRFTSVVIDDVSSIKSSTSSSITFFNGAFCYLEDLAFTKAAACFVKEKCVGKLPQNVIPVIVQDPYLAIAQMLHKCIGTGEAIPTSFLESTSSGISKHSVISSCAKIGENVTIMPNVYIGANVNIQDGVVIHSNASLEHCTVGKNSVIRSGVRIGTAGFGFVPNFIHGNHIPVPQISRVIIGENVDIGANSCVDRGFLTDTKIGNNTKIDNLVHIAHGVEIGQSCFIAGCVGIAGSTKIGNFCMIGGHSAISGHITIADYTQITGMSGVAKSIEKPRTTVSGIPAVETSLWKKMHIYLLRGIKK